jgi:ABC-type antimicrobial peptide transport system permease subunit
MTLRAALRALRRNKLRSALTTLGVVIGVAAVILMVSVGQGASEAVRREIESLGTNLLMVVPGATTKAGVRSGFGGVSTLTVQDARALAAESSAIAATTWIKRQIAQVVQGERNWSTSIQGVSPGFFEVREWGLVSGEPFGTRDDASANRVALLGQTVVENLFGAGEDPLGATIRVRGVPFRVIGVLERKGQTSWGQDQDDVVIVPFNTAERRVLGTELLGTVDLIYASVERSEDLELAVAQATALLRQRHRIGPDADDDFTVRNLNEMARAQESTSRLMETLLLSVASISLLVGGIGIMNILLVSVTERTREIGIRMAVGAKPRHVLLQFLTEAVVLAGAGGALGAVLGIAGSAALSALAGWPTLVPPAAVAGSLLFALAVGVFFGFWPARRAAALDPIAALRWE